MNFYSIFEGIIITRNSITQRLKNNFADFTVITVST